MILYQCFPQHLHGFIGFTKTEGFLTLNVAATWLVASGLTPQSLTTSLAHVAAWSIGPAADAQLIVWSPNGKRLAPLRQNIRKGLEDENECIVLGAL